MYIERQMSGTLRCVMDEYPIVTVSGPRQSGKTTLVRKCLGGYGYVNLEDSDTAEFARSDPKGFLMRYPAPLVIDEVQRVPGLMSSLQVAVDSRRDAMGQYVLTGSHQSLLRENVAQSLAGRTAMLDLLPLSLAELGAVADGMDADEIMLRGFMPEIWRQGVSPSRYYRNYLRTYVERDVRAMVNVRNLAMFEKFLRLLAGRIGQLANLSQLSVEVGVSSTTLGEWLSVLEASYITFTLPCYYRNFGKRFVKAPKVYFTDVGLCCHLLGIRDPQQVDRDPAFGGLFENIVAEAIKKSGGELYYYRREDSRLKEDFFLRSRSNIVPIEVKATTGRSKSLRTLIDSGHYPDIAFGVKVVDGNLGFANNIYTVPHFCAFLIKDWLSRK